MAPSEAETRACQKLVELALTEDLGARGDVTSQATIPAEMQGHAVFVARASGVLAGLPAAALVAAAIDRDLRFRPLFEDGRPVDRGTRLATVAGSMRSILAMERTALNFLQHLSGIATLTRKYVEAVAGQKARILDTRKTLPGWRLLQKYAVRCGGGDNHRVGLYDGILIKDNHLKGMQIADCRLQIENAIASAKAAASGGMTVEVEVETLEQFDVELHSRPDIILLDNMSLEQLRQAVRRRDTAAPGILLEASGGVNLDTVRAIAETGVDRISVGALTHSATALDVALDYEREPSK
jgi:nicotinate-nucleotide pyrophosphorylase (carboxylating)